MSAPTQPTNTAVPAASQPSTLQSYVDSATATVQSAISSLTGSNVDKASAEAKKEAAADEHAASHASAKIGPVSVASGTATLDNQDRRDGQWNETVGSAKKALGNLTGNESLKASGTRQEQEGQGQKAAGQLTDLASGTADRLTGTVGGGLSSLVGNTSAQAEYQHQHDQGKATVRGVEHDVNAETKY
ncbi:hypothetical protein DFH27DRAFT_597154 [Peziza echinospora]|nr:hypothetical protein DFH27DRAFT_597154 [Peziza echinospora]